MDMKEEFTIAGIYKNELAVALANALANAIYTNLKLHCKMVETPGIMPEISNPCISNISFDGTGLPV